MLDLRFVLKEMKSLKEGLVQNGTKEDVPSKKTQIATHITYKI